MNWKLMTAAVLVVFLAVGCGAPRTTVTLQNNLGEWKITSLTLTGPGTEETTLDAMAVNEKVELQLAHGSYTLNATDEEGNKYRVPFTVAAEAKTVPIDFAHCLGFDYTIEVTEGVYWTGSGDALVTVINDTGGWSIWYVYCDLSTEDYWGEDRMGAHILHQGEELNILVPAGTYDILCEDEDGDSYTRWDVDVAAGSPYIWNVTLDDLDYGWDDYDYDFGEEDVIIGDGLAPITIHNNLGAWEIRHVYVDVFAIPAFEGMHFEEVIAPGESAVFRVNPSTYDLRVEDEDGDTYTRYSVVIPATGYHWSVELEEID